MPYIFGRRLLHGGVIMYCSWFDTAFLTHTGEWASACWLLNLVSFSPVNKSHEHSICSFAQILVSLQPERTASTSTSLNPKDLHSGVLHLFGLRRQTTYTAKSRIRRKHQRSLLWLWSLIDTGNMDLCWPRVVDSKIPHPTIWVKGVKTAHMIV